MTANGQSYLYPFNRKKHADNALPWEVFIVIQTKREKLSPKLP